ncbi:MAG: hypothetical protein KAY37_09735, partial [Phycisphaerae bacterium]|nr:hypothetical protein [Phycisphaerae bacterium]
MNLERFLAKLRWDGPLLLLAREYDRRWRRRRANRRRRARWEGTAVAVSPDDMPADFSSEAAERLWPGAADRSWLAAAPRRWP